MHTHHRHPLSAVAVLLLLLPGTSRAQGFGLNEIGSCAVARAGAATGAPCADASLVYWSPASGTSLKGFSVLVGGAAVAVNGAFVADTTLTRYKGDVPTEVPPHFFVNWHPGGDRYALALGVFVPYGLTSQWRSDFPGRFAAQKASLATFYVQPNISFDLDDAGRFSIGGGPVIGHSSVELRQALDLSSVTARPPVTFGQLGIPLRTEFGTAKLKGSATAYGFNLGAHVQATEHVQLNGRYLSALSFNYDDADATFQQTITGLVLPAFNPLGLPAGTPVDALLVGQFRTTGALTPQKVKTAIKHPAQAQIGIGFTGLSNTTLSLDGSYVQWSAFKELPVQFQGAAPSRTLYEDYKDSYGVRGSVDHLFANGWSGRGGLSYYGTPAPDETVTPLLPDMNRTNLAVGTAIPFGGRYALDVSYLAVLTSGRRGRIAERTDRAQTAAQLNSGVYELNANVFSASIKAQF
ncbi:MAG: outer membrane protein transport protein [Gemmatimonadaceae bacterium]